MMNNLLIENIFLNYGHIIKKLTMSILNDEFLAEDCLNDTILRLIKKKEKLEVLDQNSLKGYVLAVAQNSAIDLYRKRKKEILIENLDFINLQYYSNYVIDDRIKKDCIIEELFPLEKKSNIEMFKLKYIYGLSYKEIAIASNLKVGTVAKRIQRMRVKAKIL